MVIILLLMTIVYIGRYLLQINNLNGEYLDPNVNSKLQKEKLKNVVPVQRNAFSKIPSSKF
jgi:hypothetical protein